jgi:serine/threonine protein kinase
MTQFYGITQDPKTNDFMMIIEYATNGSLRQHLNNSFNLLGWKEKMHILQKIAVGLGKIHDNELIHHNFHCGNILSNLSIDASITDLGIYQPANVQTSQSDNKKIYGVLPYVAPEVLKRKEYTQASDIYGFGIIAYEVCTGLPPYHDTAHEEPLAIRICDGQRPKTSYEIPQLILDIIKQCWDADPLKRPKAEELSTLLWNLYSDAEYEENSVINKQIKDADEINNSLIESTDAFSYTTHPQAVYTSRLLDFENLPEPKNSDE